MNRFALALTALALALAGTVAADEKAALKELEGTYKIVSAERGGKAAPKELTDTAVVTIKGDEFAISFSPDDKKVSKIKVGGDAKLATIDLSPSDGEAKGKTFPGVYKLEKGELTLVFTEKDKADRPKEFKSDDDAILLKLKKNEK
jgi:uncharacterized protein (TIGR03067 family)